MNNMNGKRSEVEIYANILEVARDGAKKSHIVYKANLNFKIVKKYLGTLNRASLITVPEERGKLFWTTEKGFKYLDHYKGLKEYMKEPDFASL